MTPASKRVYSTRHRTRAADKEARYDDIFSAVSRAVQDEGQFGGISRRLIEENSMPVRMRLFSQSSHEESSSDEDDGSDGSQVVPVPPPSSASGRPQRRAALAARNAFEAVETIQEATDEQFQQLLSSHAAALAASAAARAAETAKRKASEDAIKRVMMVERERDRRENDRQRFPCALCPMYYGRHMQLHKHIIEKHPHNPCASCKQPWRVLKQRHECFKCGQFAPNIEKHLIQSHYAVSSRQGALLECSRCSRTFDHLKEVLHHEKTVHGVLHRQGVKKRTPPIAAKKAQFHCRACGDAFDTRYVRDQHLTKHFQSVLESVWLKIEQMQEASPDRFLINQCPLCDTVMSSRKSFRTHIIHRHLMVEQTSLETLVGPGVKQEELLTVREHIALEGRKNNTDPVDLPPIARETVKEEEVEEETESEEILESQEISTISE